MKEVHGEEVWVDYPGRGPRPAPSHEERLKRVGILGYSTKVSRLYREAREIGDKELSLEFNRKDIEFATRADQRVGPQIKEGMEYVEHIRDALGRMPRFLQPRTLNHYADQLVLIDGMLNAKDYEEWEWYQAQDRRLWANMELDPKVTSAADERTAEFQRRLAEQSPPVLDYAVWSRKLLARAGESVQMSKQLEERIGEVGERAYYFKLHWRHMAAKKAGDQATVEEMYQAKIRYLLGEYGPPEIEEGLQFFLELRKAIQDEPVPMPQEQADHYVNLFVRLNGLMSAENVQDADLYRRECRRWMQGAEHRIDEKVKALVAEKKKEYEQKLKTMK
jgi:hypothetical protein